MKRNFSLFLLALALLCLSAPAGATVIYVSGDQTGTWSADTVIVTAEVRVPPGESLTISPGVEVLFQVYCKLIVDSAATLLAVGTEVDSIRFDVLPHNTTWHGIRFLYASDSSRLEYCHLRRGLATGSGEDDKGGAVYCSSSSPYISNNALSGNSAGEGGGGIYCYNSSPSICSNSISGNFALFGGGIYCDNSSGSIIGNTISGNWAPYAGGGIYCINSSPSISGNTISENSVSDNYELPAFGGGIYCDHSSPTISNNTISENTVSGGYMGEADGGGICCGNISHPDIIGNTISGNQAFFGGAIYCTGNSNPDIIGNTICENVAAMLGGGIQCGISDPTVVNCILWGNSPQQIYGSPLVNYSDIQDTLWPGVGNISTDPLFVDAANGDYHVQSTVGSFHGGLWTPDPLHSPCIDAGDPSSPFANEPLPNGGRINMGFEGNTTEASLSAPAWAPPPIADLPREFCLYSPHPNPFNATTVIICQLPVASYISLEIFDISGRKLVELASGFHLPGEYRYVWDASGRAAGMYFVRLRAGETRIIEKVVMLK